MTGTMKVVIWFVVLVGLAAVAGALITGGMNRDVEVEEKPYEAALQWDRDMTRMSELGWNKREVYVEFKAGSAVLTVELSARDGAPVKLNPDDVSVVATRPAGDLRDITCKAEVPRDGVIRALCHDLPFGHWEFIVNIDTDEGPVKIVERTYVKKRSR